MIKINDLRVGNIVNGATSKETFTLTIDMIIHIAKRAANVIGISITHEWFIKLGFRFEDESFFDYGEKIHNSNSYYLKRDYADLHIRHMLKENEFYVWLKYNPTENRSYMSEELKFYDNQFLFRTKNLLVHDLQNIYYSLTKNEI